MTPILGVAYRRRLTLRRKPPLIGWGALELHVPLANVQLLDRIAGLVAGIGSDAAFGDLVGQRFRKWQIP